MFKRRTIRARLAVAFLGLLLIVLLVAGLSLKSLAASNDRFAAYVNGIEARADMAVQVRSAVDRRAIAARNLVLVAKPADVEAEKAAVTRAHEDVQSNLAALQRMVEAPDVSPRARELVGEIVRIEQAYGPVALAIFDLVLKQRKSEAIAKMDEECRPLLVALQKAADDYAAYTQQRAHGLVLEGQSTYTTQRNLLALVCLGALGAAALAGVLVTRSITVPIAQAVTLAEAVAAGDLTVRIDSSGRDEISRLLASLGCMSEGLRRIVGQVRQSSDGIATGSAQIATGNGDLSQRTEEQASALEQTAASMEQLGSTVRSNADNARQAHQLAQGATAVAARGGEAVTRVVHTMKGINDSSRRIADITAVIDGIAFQTNILALNAAVEAARAGEQGRGFAIVAGEVRTLAQRSAEAAREIKSLIAASVEQVEAGSAQVDQAGATMREIVAAIGRVGDIVGEISVASNQQSAGVSQVGEAVGQMDRTTQQNAALVEESAAAAESLRMQAQQLVQAVSVFKLAA